MSEKIINILVNHYLLTCKFFAVCINRKKKYCLLQNKFRNIMKYFEAVIPRVFGIAILFVIIFPSKGFAALSTVTITSLPSPDIMSDGRGYFLASGVNAAKTYSFDIHFVNPGAGAQTDYDYFELTIPTDGADIVATWDADGGGMSLSPAVAGELVAIRDNPYSDLLSVDWSNDTITFVIRFFWGAVPSINTSQPIVATVVSTFGGTVSKSDTAVLTYGIAANPRVVSFAQNGEAADGKVLPVNRIDSTGNAADFNVTGRLVYDLPGYSGETAADVIADDDISSVTLQLCNRDNNALNYTHGTTDTDNNLSYTILSTQNIAPRTQGYYWQVSTVFAGTGTTETSPSDNRLSIEINYCTVTGMRFLGGVGRGPTSPAPDNLSRYYRRYGQAGTQVEITARMFLDSGSGLNMPNDTVYTVSYTNGSSTGTFLLTVPANSQTGTAFLSYDAAGGFLDAWQASETTVPWTYSINGISSGAYGRQISGDGNAAAVTNVIYWDKNDPPSTGTPAINITRVALSANSFTLYWTPINYSVIGDEDIYEYRIYFREYKQDNSEQWRVWDFNNDTTLRWPNLNEHITTEGKYALIPGLKIYTVYEYYITAVDIFGNEISQANAGPLLVNRIIRTQPYSVEIALSDGITLFDNASFADLTPQVRTLRRTNIKVDITIISAEEMPQKVYLWYASGDKDTLPDIVNSAENRINSEGFNETTLYSVEALKSAPNVFTAYLSTDAAVMIDQSAVRFIVQTESGGISAFIDSEVEPHPLTNPNDDEWTLFISDTVNFKPWPVRILNNVLTSKNPICYPAYYLTDDAFVTIKVYDIKGRPVATLLDDAFRRGGQNIKENGWRGTNRSGKKLGIGLYYVHFTAKRSSDNKVILNKTLKMVVSK